MTPFTPPNRHVGFPRKKSRDRLDKGLLIDVPRYISLREAEELTDYAVTTRYPGEAAEVTDAEAQHAIALAERGVQPRPCRPPRP